eukprot:623331_1
MDAIVLAVDDIASFNDNPGTLLNTLRNLTKKLLKDDVRYRTLDTHNTNIVNPGTLLNTLRNLTKKLLKDDVRYRTLDTHNTNIVDRVLSYEGVLDFLTLLGYEPDMSRTKLLCKTKPQPLLVRNAITVLDQYRHKFHFNPTNKIYDDEGNDTMTLQQIIIWGTHENIRDNDTIDALTLMHKRFTKSITLLRALKQRFFLQPPMTITDDVALGKWRINVLKRVQLRTIKALRDWMKGYWVDDFAFDCEMQEELNDWFQQMEQTENAPTWYSILVKFVRKEVAMRQKLEFPKQPCYVDDMELINTNALVVGYFRSIGNCFADNPYYDAPPNVLFYCVQYFEGSLSLLDPKQIAEQLTLIDFERMKKTKVREFLHYVCGIDDETKNVFQMLNAYQGIIEYVEGSIMNVNKSFVDEIRNTIIRMIQICQHLVDLHNFHSAYAVYTGLALLSVQSLEEAWEDVDERYWNQFTQIQELFSSLRNHYHLRTMYESICMNQSTSPSIPCMRLFLTDLERINKKSQSNTTETCVGGYNRGQRMMGFSKSVQLANRIKALQSYQFHNRTNSFALQRN